MCLFSNGDPFAGLLQTENKQLILFIIKLSIQEKICFFKYPLKRN